MLLTRFVRNQLRVFAVLALVAIVFVSVVYGQLPARLGVGHLRASAVFTDASGLYPDANVTYRGVTVGKVEALHLVDGGVRADLVISDDHPVPADTRAELHSTSAIGEQYVDLVPDSDAGPYLADGDEIPVERTEGMPQIAPVLDELTDLLASVPLDATGRVLDQVRTGLGGSADDVEALVASTSDLVASAQDRIGATRSLIATLDPVLATQEDLAGETRAYARALASFTDQVADRDGDLQALLGSGPADVDAVRGLEAKVAPTLPTLLANLTANADVLRTYLPNLEQSLVTYPVLLASLQTAINPRIGQGDVNLDLEASALDPPSCTTGYLGVGERRSPRDTSARRTDGTSHCALAPDAPEGVRGLRNLPCPDSARRAPSSAACGIRFDDPVEVRAGLADLSRGLDAAYVDPTGHLAVIPTLTVVEGEDAWTSLLTGPLDAVAVSRDR